MEHHLEDQQSSQRTPGWGLWQVDFHLLYIGGIIYILTLLLTSVITWVPGQRYMPFLFSGVAIQSFFLLPTLLTRVYDRQRRCSKIAHYLLANVIVVVLVGIITGVSIYLLIK